MMMLQHLPLLQQYKVNLPVIQHLVEVQHRMLDVEEAAETLEHAVEVVEEIDHADNDLDQNILKRR